MPTDFRVRDLNASVSINTIDLFANNAVFSNRPIVNGTGVMLNGDPVSLPNTVVYQTGNQTISGTKTFVSTIVGSISGNASTSSQWLSSRNITLAGDASGTVSINGSQDATLTVTVLDNSHNHTIANVTSLQTSLDAKAPLSSPSFVGTPTAPSAAEGTSSTQIASTAFVNSYFVSNRLSTPIQSFNPWGVNKLYDAVATNRFHGRSEKLSLSVDGGAASTPSTTLTDSSYEGGDAYGVVGGSPVVLLFDFITNGLTNSNGFTYADGQFHIHFYPGRHPTAITARVRNRDGVWTAMTMTGYKVYSGSNYISWRGACPIGNYITAVEFTLTPQATGNNIQLTELEYHGTRMGVSEGGLLTAAGGSVYGNLIISNDITASNITVSNQINGNIIFGGTAITAPNQTVETNNSLMTRLLAQKESLFSLSLVRPIFSFASNTSGTGTAAASTNSENLGFTIDGQYTASAWQRVGLVRSWTQNVGFSGGNNNTATPVAFSISFFPTMHASATAELRFVVGDAGSGAPPAYGANAIAGRGFGAIMYYSTANAQFEMKLFAHNGTTYVSSSGASINYSSMLLNKLATMILTSDGAGTIKLFWGIAASDNAVPVRASTTALITLTGGPTSGNYAGPYFSILNVNNSTPPTSPNRTLVRGLNAMMHVGTAY